MHQESRNVTNSKLDWAVVFTARYPRRNRKTVHLSARLCKLSEAVADLLGNHEGDVLGYGSRSIRTRDLGAVLCKQAKTAKNLLTYTRKPRELAGILRYLYRCGQLMLGFKVASSKSNTL